MSLQPTKIYLFGEKDAEIRIYSLLRMNIRPLQAFFVGLYVTLTLVKAPDWDKIK